MIPICYRIPRVRTSTSALKLGDVIHVRTYVYTRVLLNRITIFFCSFLANCKCDSYYQYIFELFNDECLTAQEA